MFAGFDAYIEELFVLCFAFREAGYEVIIFEGPGQGAYTTLLANDMLSGRGPKADRYCCF